MYHCTQSLTRCSENDSTLGQLRSEMPTLAEHGHFKQWFASWYTASCHQISGHNAFSSHFLKWVIISQTWFKPIMESFKVHWNAWKLTKHGHFKQQCTSWYCASSYDISGQYLKYFKQYCHPSDLVQAYHGNFTVPWNDKKIGRTWPYHLVICFTVGNQLPSTQLPSTKNGVGVER